MRPLTHAGPAKTGSGAGSAAGNVNGTGTLDKMPVSPEAIASSVAATGGIMGDSVQVGALADKVYRMIVDRVAQDLRMRGR